MRHLFCENNGQLSSVRVMSFIALFVAIFVTVYGTLSCGKVPMDILIIWLTAAFCPKVIQKFAEKDAHHGT